MQVEYEDDNRGDEAPAEHEASANHEHKHKKSNVEMKISFSRAKAWIVAIALLLLIAVTIAWKLSAFAKVQAWYNRASVSVTVLEMDTRHPIVDAKVTANDKTVYTDSQGLAQINGLVSGNATITIDKSGYVSKTYAVAIYRGKNPLADEILQKAPDKTYALTGTLTDAITAEPIAGAKIVVDGQNLVSDAKGLITAQIRAATVSMQITQPGYTALTVPLVFTAKQTYDPVQAQLVPTQKIVFEQEQGGKTDLYTTDLTGKNVARLLSDKQPNDNSDAIVSPDQKSIVFLSKRDGTNNNGAVANKLYVRDNNGNVTKLSDDLDPRYIQWLGNGTIVYITHPSTDTGRDYIISVNTSTQKRTALTTYASTDPAYVSIAQMLVSPDPSAQTIYYAYSPADITNTNFTGLFNIKGDGTNRLRVGPDTITNNIERIRITSDGKALRYTFEDAAGFQIHSINLATNQDSDVTKTPTIFERLYLKTHLYDGSDLLGHDTTTLITKDGRTIYIDTKNEQTDAFLLAADGKTVTQLTKLGDVQSIYLSSDEKYLLIGKQLNNSMAIFAIGLNGGDAKKISDSASTNVAFLPN